MRTNSGRDWQARIMADTASSGSGNYAPANWIGITADSAAPAAGDTTLTGELTGGTMGRAQATYAHTNGSATYTLTKAFLADRTVTVQKYGIFTESSGGTMAFENTVTPTAPLNSGDTLNIIATISL